MKNIKLQKHMDSYYFWNKIYILQKYRQRRIPTTRISRVERDMDACLAGNILGRTNRLSRNGNAVILGRLGSQP